MTARDEILAAASSLATRSGDGTFSPVEIIAEMHGSGTTPIPPSAPTWRPDSAGTHPTTTSACTTTWSASHAVPTGCVDPRRSGTGLVHRASPKAT